MYLVISKLQQSKFLKFSGQYFRNHSHLDVGVLGFIVIVWPKDHSFEDSSFPPETACIYIKHIRLYHVQIVSRVSNNFQFKLFPITILSKSDVLLQAECSLCVVAAFCVHAVTFIDGLKLLQETDIYQAG
jgi:hypothetical protein